MKVLHVTREEFADRRYGLGRSVAQMMRGLAHCGVDSGLFCVGDLSTAARESASTRAYHWAGLLGEDLTPILQLISRGWEAGIQAANAARTGAFTHVHCHDSFVAHGYASASANNALPFGITHHGFDSIATSLNNHIFPVGQQVTELIGNVERSVFRRASWAVFPTALCARKTTADLALEPQAPNYFVIPHPRPPWPPMDRTRARRDLGWNSDDRVLLAVGQIVPLKRMEWIVRAMRNVDSSWRLVILGDGATQTLYAAAANAGVALPTIVATDNPAPYYAAANAFTSASATESFGMAHLEALVCGLPIACTGVAGVPEVVGDAAVLLENNEIQYASGLAAFLSDSNQVQRRNLSELALTRGAAWCHEEETARQLKLVYESSRAQQLSASDFGDPFGALYHSP